MDNVTLRDRAITNLYRTERGGLQMIGWICDFNFLVISRKIDSGIILNYFQAFAS